MASYSINATTYTCLLFLQKEQGNDFKYFEYKGEVNNIEEEVSNSLIPFFDVSSDRISGDSWVFTDTNTENYLNQLRKNKPTLERITTNIFQGPKAGADPVFILSYINIKKDTVILFSKSLDHEVELEKEILKHYIKGKLIRRNNIMNSDE